MQLHGIPFLLVRLAPTRYSCQPLHRRRTHSTPFMALEHSTSPFANHARLLRHDLESLIWILPWVCLQYERTGGGTNAFHRHPRLRWIPGGRNQDVFAAKSKFLESFTDRKKYAPLQPWSSEWQLVEGLLHWLWDEHFLRTRRRGELRLDSDGPDIVERSDSDIYNAFLGVVTRVGREHASLRYLLAHVPENG